MTYIAALRSAALKVVRSDPRFVDHTMADLERYVLSTGYMDAPFPHSSTLNLLYVYAANLRNAGGPGVNLHRFGDMVVGALAGLITENRIAPVHLPELAQRCLAWLDGPNGRPLVRGNDLRYRDQLRALAKGDHPAVPFQRHLQSVVEFIDLLNQAYGGCASIYHDSFSNHDSRLEPGRAGRCQHGLVIARRQPPGGAGRGLARGRLGVGGWQHWVCGFAGAPPDSALGGASP